MNLGNLLENLGGLVLGGESQEAPASAAAARADLCWAVEKRS